VRLQCREDFGGEAADLPMDISCGSTPRLRLIRAVLAPALSGALLIRVATMPTSLSQ
jgi:hypothetical protein